MEKVYIISHTKNGKYTWLYSGRGYIQALRYLEKYLEDAQGTRLDHIQLFALEGGERRVIFDQQTDRLINFYGQYSIVKGGK